MPFLKNSISGSGTRLLFAGLKPIVVASTGRSGSTLLHCAVAASLVKDRFGASAGSRLGRKLARASMKFVRRLSEVPHTYQRVQKTHDLFDPEYSDAARFLFIFGDPLESAQSVEFNVREKGQVWLEKHLYNLRSSGTLAEIYDRDVLNYRAQLDSWLAREYASVYPVHYESLWNEVDEISQFLGFELQLPERRPRVKKEPLARYNEQLFGELRELMRAYVEIIQARKRAAHVPPLKSLHPAVATRVA